MVSVPKLEIPLIMKGTKIGLVDAIGLNDVDGFTTIVFRGILLRELQDQETLIKLLQIEGIWLGKP